MPRILLIDDDVILLGTMIRMLERAGYGAVGVTDGKQGVDSLAVERFDLVITDILVPRHEGIETIQRIRELDQGLPIIAISGSFERAGYSALEDAKLLGADVALAKPFSVEQLLDAVRRLLDESDEELGVGG